MKKILIIVTVAILVILGLYALYIHDEFPESSGQTTLNVSSEGPYELSVIIEDIKTHEYYKGYDNETVEWMESLGDRYIWFSVDKMVIMDKHDSDKIPSVFATDVAINEIFSCNIVEQHSLIDSKDVLLVKDVTYLNESVEYFDV